MQENQNIILKKFIEIRNEESDTGGDEDIAVIRYQSLFSAQTDIDSDEGEHSETEQSEVSQIQNSSVNDISDLFTRACLLHVPDLVE